MGVVANYPLALATGLGLNAFVAFSIASQMTWADAMGLVVIEGVIILVLVLTGFRTAVFHAIPAQLKVAISVGIGLFIALIGFVDAGFVRRIPDARHDRPRAARAGRASSRAGRSWSSRSGSLLLIALWVRKVKGAILISIVVTTRRRDHHRGGRRHRARLRRGVQPEGLAADDSSVPGLDDLVGDPGLRHARRVQPARVASSRSAS